MIIKRIYENQHLLSLKLVSFLVGLRTYQHPCTTSTHVISFRILIEFSAFYWNYKLIRETVVKQ